MAVTIGSNISSLRAQRNLATSTNKLSSVFQKLSSGSRLNKASDDAAGLSIADNLKAQQSVASVAIRNANDGISSIAIADGAMNEISSVLTRLAELAEQSANGVYTTLQRSAIAEEFTALGSEIERIAATTQFNGVNLLDGKNNMTLQVGFNSASTSQISFTGVSGKLSSLGLATSGSSALSYSLNDISSTAAQSASRAALDAVNSAIQSLASTRGNLGAIESRLNVAINNLSVAKENFASAESQIRDTDVAAEAAELTRLNILQQAGTAVLAQANQQPQLALSLLG